MVFSHEILGVFCDPCRLLFLCQISFMQILKTVNAILQKSHSSEKRVLEAKGGSITSTTEGFSGSLIQVQSLIKLLSSYLLQRCGI